VEDPQQFHSKFPWESVVKEFLKSIYICRSYDQKSRVYCSIETQWTCSGLEMLVSAWTSAAHCRNV